MSRKKYGARIKLKINKEYEAGGVLFVYVKPCA